MTLASPTSRVDYIGNGSTDTYPYTFKILAATDLLVTVRDTAEVETTLAYLTDYTVTGAGSGGGDVVLTAGNLASGYSLTIRRVRPLTQGTDIRNQGAFYPEAHEDAFDHQVMIAQQHADELARTIKLPETEAGTSVGTTIPSAASRAGKLLGFDGSGNPTALTTIPTSSVAISAFGESLIDDADAETARATLGIDGAGGVIETGDIADDAVTQDKISNDAVGADQLRDDPSVDANRAVTTNHIRDGAVTYEKIASNVLDVLVNGWGVIGDTDGWSYDSANFIRNNSEDLSGLIRTGDRIKILQDGITKYFYVGTVSVGGGQTLIAIDAGTSFTLTSNAITDVEFSKLSRPSGFPAKFTFDASPFGFSTYSQSNYYSMDCNGIITASLSVEGTSNANLFRIVLPFFVSSRGVRVPSAKDNSVGLTNSQLIKTSSSYIKVYKDLSDTGWTASGTKSIEGTIVYPVRNDYIV